MTLNFFNELFTGMTGFGRSIYQGAVDYPLKPQIRAVPLIPEDGDTFEFYKGLEIPLGIFDKPQGALRVDIGLMVWGMAHHLHISGIKESKLYSFAQAVRKAQKLTTESYNAFEAKEFRMAKKSVEKHENHISATAALCCLIEVDQAIQLLDVGTYISASQCLMKAGECYGRAYATDLPNDAARNVLEARRQLSSFLGKLRHKDKEPYKDEVTRKYINGDFQSKIDAGRWAHEKYGVNEQVVATRWLSRNSLSSFKKS